MGSKVSRPFYRRSGIIATQFLSLEQGDQERGSQEPQLAHCGIDFTGMADFIRDFEFVNVERTPPSAECVMLLAICSRDH
jgi:hypothetical protein